MRQERITRIYDRSATYYDLMQAPMERFVAARWRPLLFTGLTGRILELGVGTGKNLPHYPVDAYVTAIDPAERMLEKARRRAKADSINVTLLQADAQELPFDKESFSAIVASFVFCSVADPGKALSEALRVLEAGGELRLLEHQRPPQPKLARSFDLLNPLAVRLTGANINRPTDATVAASGFSLDSSQPLDRFGIVRLIKARSPSFEARGKMNAPS